MNNYPFSCYSEFPRRVGELKWSPTAAEIEAEPMLFKADLNFAKEHGGPILQSFLGIAESLDEIWGDRFVIDTRTHMLMEGWYPAIPGWHHDDVARTRPDGQPEYIAVSNEGILMPAGYESKHLMMVVDASDQPTLSLTQFVQGVIKLPAPYGTGRPVYSAWHDALEAQADVYEHQRVASGVAYRFDWNDMHRVMPALGFGWRQFIRMTWSTDDKPVNKIRRNANVYLEAVNDGW